MALGEVIMARLWTINRFVTPSSRGDLAKVFVPALYIQHGKQVAASFFCFKGKCHLLLFILCTVWLLPVAFTALLMAIRRGSDRVYCSQGPRASIRRTGSVTCCASITRSVVLCRVSAPWVASWPVLSERIPKNSLRYRRQADTSNHSVSVCGRGYDAGVGFEHPSSLI
jgi:hypothetical protein